MLHEIAASDLDVTHIVSPLRTLLRRTQVFVGSVESIDLEKRRVLVSHGFDRHAHEIEYDHVIIALGSITNFYHLPGLETNAFTMKTLGDAIHLRNRVIATLEEADTECASPQDDGRPRRSRFLDGRALVTGRLRRDSRPAVRAVLSTDRAACHARGGDFGASAPL